MSLAGLAADAVTRLRAGVGLLARLAGAVPITAACAGRTGPMVAAGATVRLPLLRRPVLRDPLGCMAVTVE